MSEAALLQRPYGLKHKEARQEKIRDIRALCERYGIHIATSVDEWEAVANQVTTNAYKPNGAGYVRFSSIMQSDSFSLEAQIRQIMNYAEREGVQVVIIFADPIESAYRKRYRPGIRALFRSLPTGKIKIAYVHKLDRLARRLEWMLEVVGEMQKHNVVLRAVEQRFDINTPDGKLLFQLISSMGEFFSNNLSKETMKGKFESAQRGYHNGSPPWGYLSEQDGPRKVGGPDPVNAPGAVQMFERFATGIYSDQNIADWLNARGYLNARGLKFTQHNVRDMLQNPYYAGYVRYKGKAINPNDKCYRSANAELYPGLHPALISKELFDLCQDVRAARRKNNGSNQAISYPYLVNRIIVCVHCGRRLRAQSGHIRYYREMSYQSGLECAASHVGARADVIDEQVAQLIRALRLPEQWEEAVQAVMKVSPDGPNPETEKRRLREQLHRMRENYTLGLYEDDQHTYRKQVKEIQDKLALLKQAPHNIVQQAAATLLNLRESWEYATPEERRTLTQMILQEVGCDVLETQVVWVRPRMGYEILFRLAPEWGAFDSHGKFHPAWPWLMALEQKGHCVTEGKNC
ncbi:MAG: recombinase family protein [Chloroflexota bacterium]